MEYSNLNSISDVEADRASFHPTVERTCDEQRNFAGTGQEYQLRLHPDLTPKAHLSNVDINRNSVDLYQCARNRLDSGSGSDSAKEENSPYSSMESSKYESFVPSGNTQEEIVRKERKEPRVTDCRHGQHVMPRQRSLEVNHGTGPYAMESDVQEPSKTVVPTGSSTQQVRQAQLSPRGEIEALINRTDHHQEKLGIRRPHEAENIAVFKDLDARLASFIQYSGWPHRRPSAEQMAKAGLYYKGAVKIDGNNVYDMVTCHKCGRTLYGFVENEDPVEEHKKFYPDCN